MTWLQSDSNFEQQKWIYVQTRSGEIIKFPSEMEACEYCNENMGTILDNYKTELVNDNVREYK